MKYENLYKQEARTSEWSYRIVGTEVFSLITPLQTNPEPKKQKTYVFAIEVYSYSRKKCYALKFSP